MVHRYILLSASSGQNAHSHSAALRVVHNVGTTKPHGAKSQNFNTDRRMRTKSSRNPRTPRRKRRVRLGDVVREDHGLYCAVAPGRDKSRVIQACTRGEQQKVLRRTTELMSLKVFARVKKASKSAIIHFGQDIPTSNYHAALAIY